MLSDKNQMLEPITAVARLITLAFEPKGTKIAIRDHNVVLCNPKTDSYYGFKIPQGVDRYLNGDSRDDIYVLNHVICNFIEWYVIPYSKKENEQSDKKLFQGLINMVMYLCVGLRELQNTYKSGTAVGTIQYYINVLIAVANNTFQMDMLYNPTTTEWTTFLDSPADIQSIVYSTIFDVNKFKTFWSREELLSLCDQFDQCFTKHDKYDRYVFQSEEPIDDRCNKFGTDSLLESESKDESAILNADLDQSIQKNRNTVKIHPIAIKTLPVPKSQKNAILQGDLVGIAKILSIMDRRFTNMLNHSVKGI
jgi:hypothetical protein